MPGMRTDKMVPFINLNANPFQICVDVYRRISAPDTEIETARAVAIANIAKYVKEHPRARQAELQNVVEAEIEVFRNKIRNL
jgi:hypothetical protein